MPQIKITLIEEKRKFSVDNFPHIDFINSGAYFNRTGKLWPLCNLKGETGSCTNSIGVFADKTSEQLGRFELPQPILWENIPRVKRCVDCRFHNRNCNEKHINGMK